MEHIIPYLAGFFDGEGCITIVKNKPRFWIPEYNLIISATQIDPKPLLIFKETFGGFIHKKKYHKDNQRVIGSWIGGRQIAAKALTAMLPYLV